MVMVSERYAVQIHARAFENERLTQSSFFHSLQISPAYRFWQFGPIQRFYGRGIKFYHIKKARSGNMTAARRDEPVAQISYCRPHDSFTRWYQIDFMEWIIITAISLGVLVIGLLIALPSIIKAQINKALQTQPEYSGKVSRVQVRLIQGKITIHELIFHKPQSVDNNLRIDLQAPHIMCTFRWRQLLSRRLDLTLIVENPLIGITSLSSTKPERDTNKAVTLSLKEPLSSMMPFTVDAKIYNGTVKFVKSGDPDFVTEITGLEVSVDQFNNQKATQPCSINITGILYEGKAVINSMLYPMASALQLNADLEIRSINLVLLNDLFRKFAKIDLNKGTLDVDSQISINDNMFKGHITPILKDLDFIGAEDRNDNIFRRIWERIVAAGVQLLQNNREDQLASRIPIEGRLDDPKINIPAMIGEILKNAFFKPLRPSLENVIDVPGFMNVARKKSRTFFENFFGTHQREHADR
jgi:hypothetical protein